MKTYKATISQYSNQKNINDIYRCLIAEKENLKTARSECDIIKHQDHIEFKIVAEDATALRASLNSISRYLVIYDKIKKLLKTG